MYTDRQSDADDTQSVTTIDSPPGAHEGLQPARIYHPLSFPVLVLLMPASMCGLLARLGLQALATYDGQSIFSLAYVQALGCLVMGFGLRLKEPFGKFYGPLYTALTTGFCGSLTTFSGWELDTFSSWTNAAKFDRDGLRDLIDGMGKTLFTIAISLASVSFGTYLADVTAPHFPQIPPPNRFVRYSLSALAIVCYISAFPAYFLLPNSFRHHVTAALLFAYPGTLTRYLLSIQLNPLQGSMPWGTFAANSMGTALVGSLHFLRSMPNPPSQEMCAIFQGLADGYCGCLTTVSTFAAEVHALGRSRGFKYVLVSWTMGQILLFIVLGVPIRTGRLSGQVTCLYD